MKVVPLAADSLGVRSVATYVECGATRVLIDPGATLAEHRFGLPPGEDEREALRRAHARIAAYAVRATMVFLSHYHEDHVAVDRDVYAGRTVWAKDPRRMIDPRQAQRGQRLWSAPGAGALLAAEHRHVETPDALLSASPPLSHGPDGTELGYVVALTITDRRDGFRFVHASDVLGPLSAVATAFLSRERPNLLYLSGPPGYLEHELGTAAVERGIDNLLRIIEATGCRVIVDHHAVRGADYRQRLGRLWATGQVVTAAGFLGCAEATLEARRRELWGAQRKPPGRVERRLKGPEASVIMGPRSLTRPRRREVSG
jgi:uncharacterized protein